MKTKYSMGLYALLALCFALSACKPAPVSNDRDTTAQEMTQEQTAETDALTTEPVTEEQTTEEESEPPIVIEVPEGEMPDLTALLAGENERIELLADMRGKTISQIKGQGMTFVAGSLFQKSDAGLTTNNSGWDSVGYSKPISTDTYTLQAQFAVDKNDRGGQYNAAMVGMYCKTAENLFIDGGLWFSFRENQVAIYIKQGAEKILSTNLPFSAQDGIAFCAKGDQNGAQIYANDVLIATVEIGDRLIVKDAQGKEVANCTLDNVSVNGNGYFRYMSHYANSMLESMTVLGETVRIYTPEQQMVAFHTDLSYAFAEKAQYLTDLPTAVYTDVMYADAEVLASICGFTYVPEGNTLKMERDGIALAFEAYKAEMQVNSQAYAFPTVVYTKNTFMLPVAAFGQMMGYTVQNDADIIVFSQKDNTQEAISMAKETFELYQSVIYNYDDVECDQTGVGVYDATPYEDRLVGIAYTTWHTAGRNWQTGTWVAVSTCN